VSQVSLVDEELARSLQYFVEFRFGDFSNGMKNNAVFECENALWANETGPIELAAFTIGTIQRDGNTVRVPTAGDLAENQICARKIGDHKGGSTLSAVGVRKWNDNDFSGYRFDHAASSSGEFQSSARTDSLSSAPLNGSSTSGSIDSLVLIKEMISQSGRRVNGQALKQKFAAPRSGERR